MFRRKKQQTVFVALSGGVDSAVAAALLLRQGYRVVGIFMKNWSDNTQGCCNTDTDLADARAVAIKLNILFYAWDFEKEYRDKVISRFLADYQSGRTPNPDIWCNQEIKFKLFLEKALRFGADLIATGHYAIIKPKKYPNILESVGVFFSSKQSNKSVEYHLLQGKDKTKDQSYFLCALTQKELSKTLFPLGRFKKTKTRRLAKRFGLPTARKKDSQGICFVGKINVREFLQSNLKSQPGDIVDTQGKILGKHPGAIFYTIGQREGLEIGDGQGPYYVISKDMVKNQVMVSADPNDLLLWRSEFTITNLSWTRPQRFRLRGGQAKAEVVIRYHHPAYKAELTPLKKTFQHSIECWNVVDSNLQELHVNFTKPQRAITPGQAAVIYQGKELLGCGLIDQVF